MIRRSLPYPRTRAHNSPTTSSIGERLATQSSHLTRHEGVQSLSTIPVQLVSSTGGMLLIRPYPSYTNTLGDQDSRTWTHYRT